MTAPVLRLHNVVTQGGGRTILDVAEFAVAPGETVALIGPNGAGKTTLLHVAALLRWPEAGTVKILGEMATPRNAATLRRALSVVFQDPLLFDTSVLANAAAGLRFQGRRRSEAETHARAWLARFGVVHLAGRRVRGLSGGEASRVALARAFATDPALLLLDEPFSSLDAPTRATLLPELRWRLQETGTAAVLVTHDLSEAVAFADRIAVMQRGRIAACGDVRGLLSRPPSRRVAELLGIENILTAQATCVDGERALLTLLPAGPSVQVKLAGVRLHEGQVVTFTLPEAAARALHPDEKPPPGWNCLSGLITTATRLPSGTRLVVETPTPVVAFAPWDPGQETWVVGERATVIFSPVAAHAIPDVAR